MAVPIEANVNRQRWLFLVVGPPGFPGGFFVRGLYPPKTKNPAWGGVVNVISDEVPDYCLALFVFSYSA
jgi:hypothetical protein